MTARQGSDAAAAREIDPIVLNPGSPPPGGLALAALGGELRRRLAAMIGSHTDPATGLVDYRALAASPEFTEVVATTQKLGGGRPEELETPAQQIAFWANLYNALTLHGIIALGIRRGVGEVNEFFRRLLYDVGGDHLSLVDIEHGVLRQNRPARNLPGPVWEPGNPRARWMVTRFDPRVHFALVCGARSCPPIRAYEVERLDSQLDLAARAFVNADVEIDPAAGRVRLSRIFYWYEEDFGDVLDWVLEYLDPGPGRAWLLLHRREASVEYRDYDWDLNDRSALAGSPA